MPQANAGHILLPITPEARLAGFYQEYDAAKKVWKRTKNQKLPGRVFTVINTPFTTDKGQVLNWNPLQAACWALDRAIELNADVIRVQTPGTEDKPGDRAISDWDFSVAQLVKMHRDDPLFFPKAAKDGTIKCEDESRNFVSNRWKLHESGIIAPVA